MQKELGSGVMILSYSPQGFNISGNRVLGPCAVLPPAILQWNVRPITGKYCHSFLFVVSCPALFDI